MFILFLSLGGRTQTDNSLPLLWQPQVCPPGMFAQVKLNQCLNVSKCWIVNLQGVPQLSIHFVLVVFSASSARTDVYFTIFQQPRRWQFQNSLRLTLIKLQSKTWGKLDLDIIFWYIQSLSKLYLNPVCLTFCAVTWSILDIGSKVRWVLELLSPGLLKNGKINLCRSTGSRENKQN